MAESPQVPEVRTRRTAGQQHEKYPWPDKPVLIGTRVPRLDGPARPPAARSTAYDINRPGMLHGRILRSPHPHARGSCRSISAAAEKAPGVKAVMAIAEVGQGSDVPGRRNRGGRRGDRRAGPRRAAADQGRVRGAAHTSRRSRWRCATARRQVFKDGNIKEGEAAAEPAISTPASSPAAQTSRPATRRRCRPTSRSRRTVACASGRATT